MSQPARVILLGATGSIGMQTCDVIARYPERFQLTGIAAARSDEKLKEIAARFNVRHCAILDAPSGKDLPEGWGTGTDAVCEIAALEADVVCVAIPGAAALKPTLAAIDAGTRVATATKEVLVMAGELVTQRAREKGVEIFPIDSEHSALWQCLRGEDPGSVSRLVLTASGGPFRERDPATFASITPDEALRHPTWNMGKKITIDSATMMNKGLEIIEAHFLFGVEYERIDVLIHPTSIIHSLVEFNDGATKAQLGEPDMRIPIALALTGGERLPGVAPVADLEAKSPLELFAVDERRFPAVDLARRAGLRGGVAPAALNAANEVAVAAFLDGRCKFNEITRVVEEAVAAVSDVDRPSLEQIILADSVARGFVQARLADQAAV